jgi:hypothetical protein
MALTELSTRGVEKYGAQNWAKEFKRRTRRPRREALDARDFLELASASSGQATPARRRGPRERTSFNVCVTRTADAIKDRLDADRRNFIATALVLAIAGWSPQGWQCGWHDERGRVQFGAADLDTRFTVLFDRFRTQVKEAYRRTARRSAKGIKPPSGRIKPSSGRINPLPGVFRGNKTPFASN